MTMSSDLRSVVGDVEIVERPDQNRYELRVDGDVRGVVVYCDDGDVRAIVHTEIEQSLQGHGLAAQLTERALVDIERAGKRVNPACPYVAWFIERHARFAPLLAA